MAGFFKRLLVVSVVLGALALAWVFSEQTDSENSLVMLDEVVSSSGFSQEEKTKLKAVENNLKEGNKSEALNLLDDIVKTNPDYHLLGLQVVICLEEGWWEGGIAAAQKMVEMQPDEWAYFSLGQAYGGASMNEESTEAFKKVLELNPNSAGAHEFLGANYIEKGEFEKAEEEYKILQRLDPVAALNLRKSIHEGKVGR